MKLSRFREILNLVKNSPDAQLRQILEHESGDFFTEVSEEIISMALFADFTNLLTDTGVVTEHSLFKEFTYRLNRKFFPPVYPDKEFRSILKNLNEKSKFSKLILQLSPQTLARFIERISTDNPVTESSLKRKLRSPLKILITRLMYHLTSRQIYSRLDHAQNLQSYIVEIDQVTYKCLESGDEESFERLEKYLGHCEEACDHIRENKNSEGISLEVTYRIIVILDIVERIRALVSLLDPSKKNDDSFRLAVLIQDILKQEQESGQIQTLFWEYVELVSYEITEHTGRKGEDYIQRDQAGTLKMLKKGLIGGAIVGLLAFLKPVIDEASLAPFVEAVGFSLVYSTIFLVIYFVGGVLATKQPAMTASRLANELDIAQPSDRFLWEISGLIRDTFRSQFLAIFGNFILALPVAAAVAYGLRESKLHVFYPETSDYLFNSLHPIFSLSIVYAVITGVCLAVSGIVAGALRNWFIFNKIDVRLKGNSIFKTVFGQEKVSKATEFVDQNLEGLTGNISLGFLLGFLSTLGGVLGLPIDIRHITFASAQVGTALVDPTLYYSGLGLTAVLFGVILIGVINLAVSFSITFLIAFKSRKLSFHQGRRLFLICISRFFKEPSLFLFRAEPKA